MPTSFGMLLAITGVLVIGIAAGLGLFEAVEDSPAVAVEGTHRSPEMADFYEGCIATVREGGKTSPSEQKAFCGCYAEEARARLQPQDIRAVTAGFIGGKPAIADYVVTLSQTEQVALTKRMNSFVGVSAQRCRKLALDAAQAD